MIENLLFRKKKYFMMRKHIIIALILLFVISACNTSPSNTLSQNNNQQVIQQESSFSAKVSIEDPNQIGDDTVNFPSITLENTGSNTIYLSIDVSVLRREELLDKANGVLFMTGAGGDFIQTLIPGEKVKGQLNYAYQKEIKHNDKLKVEIRNGRSATVITEDVICLSNSCDDIVRTQLVPKKKEPFVEWEVFLTECRTKWSETQWKNPTLAQRYMSECQRDYGSKYGLVEYCDKIKDRMIQEECYFNVAIETGDGTICSKLLGEKKSKCRNSAR